MQIMGNRGCKIKMYTGLLETRDSVKQGHLYIDEVCMMQDYLTQRDGLNRDK